MELFRGDPRGTVPVLGLSTSQGIAIALFFVGAAIYLSGLRKARAAGEA